MGVSWKFADVKSPHRCANEECPNRPDQGQFRLIEAGGTHRPIRIWLCAPCAEDVRDGPKTTKERLGL